jgi:hypothetical protein
MVTGKKGLVPVQEWAANLPPMFHQLCMNYAHRAATPELSPSPKQLRTVMVKLASNQEATHASSCAGRMDGTQGLIVDISCN